VPNPAPIEGGNTRGGVNVLKKRKELTFVLKENI
jgi:hypothetical protein